MILHRHSLPLVLVATFVLGCNGDGDTPPDDVPRTALAVEQAGSAASDDAVPVSEVVTVYKSASCGCCASWVEHMREAGFEVETHDVSDAELPAIKAELGVGLSHQSCHTAVVGDYVVEGHVPADLVRRMLEEQPEIAGLAVPGMPRGSPGMEMPDGSRDAYDVIAFTDDGEQRVYASR
ncbi:MAG TPA: DUF411 domain-containing protein [Gemmatimonadota bacterium]|nr:DUF411 domain-containing protein [Gemmatimonadota bacterium]